MNLSKILSYALGPIVGAALGIILLPLMTWVYEPEDIGRFSVFQIFLSLSIIFITLGLDQALIRFFYIKKNTNILMLCFIPSLIFFLIIASILFFIKSEVLNNIFDLHEDLSTFFLLITIVFLGLTNRFFSVNVRMNNKAIAFSLNQILIKLINLVYVVYIFFYMNDPGFNNLLVGVLISYLFALIVLISTYTSRKEFSIINDPMVEVIPLLKYGLPLIFSGVFYWGFTSINTFLLSKYISLSELSLYSVATNLAASAVIIQSVFSVIWAPTIFKWYEDNSNNIKYKMNNVSNMMNILILFFFGIVGLVSPLLDLILPVHYETVKIILIVCVVYPLLYILAEINGIGISLVKKNNYNLLINSLTFIINFILAIYFIPKYGIDGAVTVGLVSYFFYFIIKSEISFKLWKDPGRNLKSYAAGGIMCICAFFSYFSYDFIGSYYIFIWIIYLVLIVYYFHSKFFEIFRAFFKKSKI